MTTTPERVEAVVPRDPALVLSKAEREAILEISYLAIAADRKLRDEEIDAFRRVAARLRDLVGDPEAGPASKRPLTPVENYEITDQELADLLDHYAAGLARSDADARLRDISRALVRPEARAVAYKVAYALALCDLDTSDPEFEFDLQLIDSLDLSQEQADAFADEVLQVFNSHETVP